MKHVKFYFYFQAMCELESEVVQCPTVRFPSISIVVLYKTRPIRVGLPRATHNSFNGRGGKSASS